MHDVVTFLVACWTSGTLLRSVCALAIVPLAAWAAIRVVVPAIVRSRNDPGWQAPLAAAAAAIPGALLLVLAALALLGGLHTACLETPVGRVLFGLIISITLVALARACVFASRRSGEAVTLIRWSSPARGRLAAAANTCGIPARYLADTRPFCALAGTWQPTVIVSKGALLRLSDAELAAALLHERGHVRRGDQLIAMALSFLVDLVPLPSMDLVTIYRHAREVAADRHALSAAEPVDLAGALLSFARSESVATSGAALVGGDGLRRRLTLLLKNDRQPKASVIRRTAVASALVLILGAGLAPAGASILHPIPCSMDVSEFAGR